MTRAQPKIALSESRGIPFDKLILSQSNVRRVKAGVDIEQLADDIARRTLLQSLTVRPVLDEGGAETGIYEIPAGGRRFRALELLVKQKRLAKTAPIPCVIRTDGIAEEDSLAENVQRAPLHPLDQFRAFQALRDKGQSEEEIAAAFFVAPAVVKQRLRLAACSPVLLDAYAEDRLTLEQLMAFTVNPDHQRQEQVLAALSQVYMREPYAIRRMLTETAVRASDKRARFVGLDAYVEAGGAVLRDLFQADDGGWLQDPGLLDMLVAERLRDEAEVVRAEGWRWIEAAPERAYDRTYGMRRILGERAELIDEEADARDALIAKQEEIEASYIDDAELPPEVDARLGEIERAIAAYDNRPTQYRAEDVVIAGAFVSIDPNGLLRVERGYVRPEDEPPVAAEPTPDHDTSGEAATVGDDGIARETDAGHADPAYSGGPTAPNDPDEDDGIKPLPDRLVVELTAFRTIALREAVGRDPEVAYLAALHALCLRVFYHYMQDSCVELDLKSIGFGSNAPGVEDIPLATAIEERHRAFADRLPRDPADLWDTLVELDQHIRAELFAHCVAQGINAVVEPWSKRPRAQAHADILAGATGLNLAGHWAPTAANFFGRVTKARIVDAVREARGEAAAARMTGLKKPEMAEFAETLLTGTGWLPEQLRTPGQTVATAEQDDFCHVEAEASGSRSGGDFGTDPTEASAGTDGEDAVEQSAAIGGEQAMVEDDPSAEDEHAAFEPLAIAAE